MTLHSYAGRRAALAAALVLAVAGSLAGCRSDSADRSEAAAPRGGTSAAALDPASSASSDPAAAAPLVLTSSTVRSRTCVANRTRDFAWFDVQWQATTDLDSFSVHLDGAHGVRSVGAALTVPPVNFGGRIDYSGAIPWATRAQVGRSRQVSWIQRSVVFASSPLQDETGLLVLHLRFDGGPAEIGGVRASYRTADGAHGTAELAVPEKWRFAGRGGCD